MIYSFDNDTRLIEMKINIHLQDGEIISITKDNYLIACSILEELSSDDVSPLGAISSNEFEFELYNDNDIFTPTNKDSEYYKRIKSHCKVDVFIREDLSNSDWISMGTYYISDWKCNQGSRSIIATCNDRIQFIINADTPNISVERNISVKSFIQSILIGAGLKPNEFKIDNSLSGQLLTYAYPHSDNLGEVLTEIAKSQLCYIYMNRDNILEVISMLNFKNEPVAIWTDNDQIISSVVESSILYDYTSAKVKYVEKKIGEVENITELSNLTIPSNLVDIDTILTKEPIYELNGIVVESEQPIFVDTIRQSTNKINITLNNEYSEQQNVNLSVNGRTIKTNSVMYMEKSISDLTNDRPLEIQSDYIDNSKIAAQVLSIMYNYITEDNPFIELRIRGNPEIKIGDIVTVTDDTNKINSDYIIISQYFTFNDALDATIRCINKSILKRRF